MVACVFPRRTGCGSVSRANLIAALFAAVLLLSFPRSASAQQCTGDCNDTVSVEVNELVTGVNISLGAGQLSACRQFDANGDDLLDWLLRYRQSATERRPPDWEPST